jgi:hypothetical protein
VKRPVYDEREGAPGRAQPGMSRAQKISGAAALICYAVGYPLAILLHSVLGWALVMLGGIFLLSFGVATIRWAQRR